MLQHLIENGRAAAARRQIEKQLPRVHSGRLDPLPSLQLHSCTKARLTRTEEQTTEKKNNNETDYENYKPRAVGLEVISANHQTGLRCVPTSADGSASTRRSGEWGTMCL